MTDWQYYRGAAPPVSLNPGPGPFIDRVRIGRRVLTGPTFNVGIDTRTQGQDCCATVPNAIAPGEHFSPATDIWGSCAFSAAEDQGYIELGPNTITGDSIQMEVKDAPGAGGISQVRWYGAITSGPHVNKAPAPYTVAANGFFEVTPDSARGSGGAVVADRWFVDLDDTYFRGGDRMLYFWTGLDAGAGRSSHPAGITAANFPPVSVAAAELATSGLYELT